MTRIRWQTLCGFLVITIGLGCARVHANGESLYGVHWWDWDNGWQVQAGPDNGWSTESIITHSDPWWAANYYQPLYQDIHDNHGASIITRIDYNWGETIPSPTNPNRAQWANSVVDVVNVLGGQSNIWVIGNEPNIIGEGNGWAGNQVTPAGYAEVYQEVRAAIKANRPNDEVLLAAPSPGYVIPGVRWMSGNDWLSQTIAAVDALPGGVIDGFSLHAYGSPFLGGQSAVNLFRSDYSAQLAVIDNHGYQDAPVYITEWARDTNTGGNAAANETVTAEFIRGALADVNDWNQTPGNHNIVSLSWFVGDKDKGGWDSRSLEYWKDHGNPVGHQGDMWTAFLEGAQYAAGLKGTRSLPSGPETGDFDDDGDTNGADFLTWQRGFGTTGSALPADGDATYDGNIDEQDLAIWQQNYGTLASPLEHATAVPEPTGWMITQLAMLLLLTVGRRCLGRR